MSEIAVDIGLAAPRRPVWLSVRNWHVCHAAELLRPGIDDMLLPRTQRLRFKRLFDEILLMASGKTSWLSAAQRNQVLGLFSTSGYPPANIYFGLWTTAAATDLDGLVGNTAGEVASTGAYDRVTKVNDTSHFATISGDNPKVNTTAITWVTASANWNSSAVIPQLGVLTGNAKTAADNGLLWGDFTTAKAILNGDTAQINTSGFSYTEE